MKKEKYTSLDVALKLVQVVDIGRAFLRSKKPSQRLVNIERLIVVKQIKKEIGYVG